MNEKFFKVFAAVLAAVAAVSCVLFFLSKREGREIALPAPSAVVYDYDGSAYTSDGSLSVLGADGEIFMPTDFDGIYYTADPDGNVSFFEYADGAMKPSALKKNKADAKLRASYETLPVSIYYIEKDGKKFGCGVFNAEKNPDTDVYPYAFVKLVQKPSGYGDGLLLLADFDEKNFYRPDKIYSEIYDFDLAGGSATVCVSNNTRLIDRNGSFRRDWTLLTDDFIKNLGGAKYFLSSRYYNESDRGKRADVMILSGAYRPQIVVKDILGLWFVNGASGARYLKRTPNGFKAVLKTAGEEKTVAEFEGDYFADYLQSGEYLVNRKSLAVSDLLTGSVRTLKNIDLSAASIFSAGPGGKNFVFAEKAKINSNGAPVQKLIYCSADGSSEPAVFEEPLLFSESCGFVWLDSSSVMSARALDGSGSRCGSVVYRF